jgi:hypothetical protein
MRPADLQDAVRQKPFEPFRLVTSDGGVLDIRHPELCMVGTRVTTVGIPATEDPTLAERTIKVDNLHITKIEPLPSPTSTQQNGQGG